MCVYVKKIRERYKDKTLLQQISIQFQTPPAKPPTQFNTQFVKNNDPLMNEFEMTLVVAIVFSTTLLLLVHFLASQDERNQYWVKLTYLELACSVIYKVIIPITYLAKRKDVQTYIWNTISNRATVGTLWVWINPNINLNVNLLID